MTDKLKKVARTVYLPPEIWEYIDFCGLACSRKHSQEIEHCVKKLREIREKNNLEAIAMAEQGMNRLLQQQSQ